MRLVEQELEYISMSCLRLWRKPLNNRTVVGKTRGQHPYATNRESSRGKRSLTEILTVTGVSFPRHTEATRILGTFEVIRSAVCQFRKQSDREYLVLLFGKTIGPFGFRNERRRYALRGKSMAILETTDRAGIVDG